MSDILLAVENVTRRFGGLTAVKNVSFTLRKGEITGILGPNGAGKTTLFNLITGFIRNNEGTITFDGHPLAGLKPFRIVNLGLARTFQLTRPFIGMTVVENVIVGCLAPRVRADGPTDARARHMLNRVGLGPKADQPVESLSYGDLRRLEIARELVTRPKLLLLDEPFAGLGTSEIEPLAALIRELHGSEGLTILMVEHRLREFMALVTRVIAMDFGEVIADGVPSEITRNPRVVKAYIGGTVEEAVAAAELQGLTVDYGKAPAIDALNLHVDAGELVCVLGPNGAGKSTLLRAVSGAIGWTGSVQFNGHSMAALPAHKVVGYGICHCPEGRLLFPELTVLKNLELGAYLRNDRSKIAADLQEVYRLFPILKERSKQQANTLSGGEQQMVAIGRALMGAPKLLLLDEPSVGIAHRLKLMIFDAIRQIREKGTAILLVEQDATAALAVSDRAYVLEHGHVAKEGSADDLAKDDDIRRVYLGV